MKKEILFFISIFLLLASLALVFSGKKKLTHHGVGWAGNRYRVEEVDTQEAREKGLGGRKSLCSQCAMLFTFPKAAKYSFWMKDMQFPLDIIWILHGTVVHIERNISPSSKEIFSPESSADQVIEVNAGEAGLLHEGDVIEYFQ